MSGRAVPDIPAVPRPPHSAAEGPEGIRKEYVHLGRSEMVLLTSWWCKEDGEFSLSARWPAPAAGLAYDQRMLTQTVRQSGLTIAHAAYGAPLSDHTVLNYFDFTVAPGFQVPSDAPCDLTVEVTVKNAKTRGVTAVISAKGSKIPVVVLPTNEELVIARDTAEIAAKA